MSAAIQVTWYWEKEIINHIFLLTLSPSSLVRPQQKYIKRQEIELNCDSSSRLLLVQQQGSTDLTPGQFYPNLNPS